MAPFLGTFSALKVSKPKRVEGHTSSHKEPILYVQFITGTIGETTEAGDTYYLPHTMQTVVHIKAEPQLGTGPEFIRGDGTRVGCWYTDAATVLGPTQITTAATAGATAVVMTSATAINDTLNGCTVDITYSNGNVQTTKILDFVGATLVATIQDPLDQAIATTGTYYTVRGTLITVPAIAATPVITWTVYGYV